MGVNDRASEPASLIHADGRVFDDDLMDVEAVLAALANDQRESYRDGNAREIAEHDAQRLLIVAGPGAGKSFLFLARIKYWLQLHGSDSVYVASFVRKLVRDLEAETTKELPPEEQGRVRITTLHSLARSLLERSAGTATVPLRPYVKVITPEWQEMVWSDALEFLSDQRAPGYTYARFAGQVHTEVLDDLGDWPAARRFYAGLLTFYNAVGFPEMVALARRALEENPELNEHSLWIIDEYQDFNASEDHLIRVITETARGVLLAGDDEQALYEQLKASTPHIIIGYYTEASFANAMLPYCSRCGYYVCLAASAFIARHRGESAIAKIFLPLRVDEDAPRLRVLATQAPVAAVDYIDDFLQRHARELEDHRERMEAGEETDPFLLILSPTSSLRFLGYRQSDERLRELVAEWSTPVRSHSPDYRRVLTYCTVAIHPADNFAVRKVLRYEGVPDDVVHALIVLAMERNQPLADVLEEPEHVHAVELCAEVQALAVSDDLESEEKARRMSDRITIHDPTLLGEELLADPIGSSRLSKPDDESEAIQTAGPMSPVELMTIYQSKGLSAKHVIVIGCDDLNMRRLTSLAFFVALTRARSSLHLITSLQAGGSTEAHRYVLDIPEACCEYIAFTRGDGAVPLSGAADFVDKLARWQWGIAQGRRERRRS